MYSYCKPNFKPALTRGHACRIQKYIPSQATVDKQFALGHEHDHDHNNHDSISPAAALDAAQQAFAKKQPKSVNKVRMGRRAAKKAAALAAVAEAELGAASTAAPPPPSSSPPSSAQNSQAADGHGQWCSSHGGHNASSANAATAEAGPGKRNRYADKDTHAGIIAPGGGGGAYDELPVSERLLQMASEMDKFLEEIRGLAKD
ncbi:hypothetical protein VTK26DRAFT_3460 [Humicola hyalothermophila]